MHFKQVFFIWGTKKVVAGFVRQLVFLYRNDCMASKLIVLDEWSSYRNGRFSRFDYTWSSVSSERHCCCQVLLSSGTKSKNILKIHYLKLYPPINLNMILIALKNVQRNYFSYEIHLLDIYLLHYFHFVL